MSVSQVMSSSLACRFFFREHRHSQFLGCLFASLPSYFWNYSTVLDYLDQYRIKVFVFLFFYLFRVVDIATMFAAELSMNMLSFLLPFYDAGGLLVRSNRDSAADRGMLLLPCAHVTSQKPFFIFAIHMCACFLCLHRLIRRWVFVFRLSYLCCIACVCY